MLGGCFGHGKVIISISCKDAVGRENRQWLRYLSSKIIICLTYAHRVRIFTIVVVVVIYLNVEWVTVLILLVGDFVLKLLFSVVGAAWFGGENNIIRHTTTIFTYQYVVTCKTASLIPRLLSLEYSLYLTVAPWSWLCSAVNGRLSVTAFWSWGNTFGGTSCVFHLKLCFFE